MAAVFRLPEVSSLSLRDQICEVIANGVARGALEHGQHLPSCRALSRQLGVSRNTVFAAYARLADLGLVIAKDRSGYIGNDPSPARLEEVDETPYDGCPESNVRAWFSRSDDLPSQMARVEQPADWSGYPYPFVYNQIDPNLFPLEGWRECSRMALSRQNLPEWTGDLVQTDSLDLVRQLRQRLLSHRGLHVRNDEVLVTSGAQNALYILATLFGGHGRVIGVEDPGYPEARNAFRVTGSSVLGIPVDEHGLVVSKIPPGSHLVYTTPSHQFPTTVTMPMERRYALLDAAHQDGFVVVEDDYEAEMNYVKDPSPSLKSMDESGRVIYIASLSKSVSPGLRLGFMVADRAIVKEARALRNTMLRHPPTVMQNTAALFLRLGYYDAHIRRLHRRYKARWKEMASALDTYLPTITRPNSSGGTCFWMKGPKWLNSDQLGECLRERGVLIDAASPFFADKKEGRHLFRLGFASVPAKKIIPGVRLIAEEIDC